MTVNIEIPQALTNHKAWVINYPNTRVPNIVKNKALESQVSSLAPLLQTHNTNNSFPSLSLVLSKAPEYFVIDIDIQDKDTDRHKQSDTVLNTLAASLLKYAKKVTYVEQSMSGTGYHIVFKKDKLYDPFWKAIKRNSPLGFSGEILSNSGFCTFTNKCISEASLVQAIAPKHLCALLPALATVPINNDTTIKNRPITVEQQNTCNVDSVKVYLDYLIFKLNCLSPWPTKSTKRAYTAVILGEQNVDKVNDTYNHYDFWLRVLMAVKDYAATFTISELDTLAILDSWCQQDTTGGYDQVDSAGLSGFEALAAKYRSIKIGGKGNKITYKTLDSLLSYGLQQPEDIIKYMNANHFCYKVGNAYKYACIPNVNKALLLTPDHQIDLSLSLLSKQGLFDMYANKFFYMYKKDKRGTSRRVKVNYASYWVTHQERREVFSLVFKPDQPAKQSEHNLWMGFTVGDYKPDYNCDIFLAYIKDIIADGDEATYHYILAWVANIIQHPTNKSNIALVLLSRTQGTGKTFFVELLGSMLGNSYKTIGYNSTITSRFNSVYQNKLLVGIEEAVYLYNKKDQALLRYLITDKSIDIERKGHDIKETQPNYMRFIFTANDLKSVHIDPSDRRFQVVELSTKRTNDKAYFEALYNQWYKGHGREAFFNYMKSYDITNFNFIEQRIANMTTQEQKVYSLDNEAVWFHEWLQEGFIDPFMGSNIVFDDFDKDADNGTGAGADTDLSIFTHPFKVDRKCMYDDYIAYNNRRHIKYILGKTMFKKAIFRMLPKSTIREHRTTKQQQHMLYWAMPALKNVLDIFEKYMNLA